MNRAICIILLIFIAACSNHHYLRETKFYANVIRLRVKQKAPQDSTIYFSHRSLENVIVQIAGACSAKYVYFIKPIDHADLKSKGVLGGGEIATNLTLDEMLEELTREANPYQFTHLNDTIIVQLKASTHR